MHKIDVYCSVRKKYILVIQNFQFQINIPWINTWPHTSPVPIANHSFYSCISNAPMANHLRWCQSTVARWGQGQPPKKKHAAVGYRRVPREGRMWWVFSICWKLHLTFPSGKSQEIHFLRKFSHKDLKYYHLPWFIARRGKQVEKKRGPFSRLAHSCSLHSADETTNWTRSWWCTCARLQKLL